MTGKDILNAMNYLEDEIVELKTPYTAKTSGQQPKTRKTVFTKAVLKWGAVAAAAVVFLGGGIAYAAKYGLTLQENFSHEGTA